MGKIRKYVPIIKTIDAEIKGYQNLSQEIKEKITPVFELTRSRPLKNYPEGDIELRMKQLIEYTDGNPFFLDLTSHEDLANDQIIDLQDDTNAFQMWRHFLRKHKVSANIIPLLHLYDDDLSTYKACTEELLKDFETLAFRISCAQEPSDLRRYLSEIASVINLSSQYHLIIDAGYITNSNFSHLVTRSSGLIDVAREFGVIHISCHCSSFPASVMNHPRGEDDEGDMPLLELQYFSALDSSDAPITYGDFGGIHPIRKRIGGGSWVPRVDLTVDDAYIYKRYRREEGGYKLAAKEMVKWSRYQPVDCWGKEQIEEAATTEPPGKSPSFWISVRLNQHVTRLALIFSKRY